MFRWVWVTFPFVFTACTADVIPAASSSSTGATTSTTGGHTTTTGASATSSSSTAATSTSATSTTGTTMTASSTTTTSTSTSTTSTSGTTGLPFESDREACINEINRLRGTKGLSPYARWSSAESCVDQQASHDESVGTPHDAFNTGNPSCGGYGQNECPGWGPGTIVGCLDQMWDEGTQPGCSGCDACDTFTIFQGGCPNCTFNGAVVCGHYVNMTSTTFTSAACGFSTDETWAAIDFQ
ncbi:MAG: hypothetical protein JST54_17665 [Deltaproteobacteria bacterium]|nr:hypothetical protein [Deltaproteobacteria bacterium]